MDKNLNPKIMALFAALLFGTSAPFAKVLLNLVPPVQLAGILYLGSGLGLLVIKIVKSLFFKGENREAKIDMKEIKWLAGAVLFGGVAAPVILMISLKNTDASVASLLLNFEAVSTTVIALIFFKEHIGLKIWSSILLITFASMILSLDLSGTWKISLGAAGVIAACIMWGIDNNFTRNISLKDPYTIVIIKGIGAGSFSFILSIIMGNSFPGFDKIIMGMLLGFFSYGFSLILYIRALRSLGSARTSAFFGFAPFLGTIVSMLIFKDQWSRQLFLSLPFMIAGAVLLFQEKHSHFHIHEEIDHEHIHTHDDLHHNHQHETEEEQKSKHTHKHKHDKVEHDHEHSPDEHHRHKHNNI